MLCKAGHDPGRESSLQDMVFKAAAWVALAKDQLDNLLQVGDNLPNEEQWQNYGC